MDEHETWIQTTMAGAWPLLWPLRQRHAASLRRAAEALPDWLHGEARAAFGVDEPAPLLAATLYRDFYREDALPGSWDAAIGAFRRGDPGPLDLRVREVTGTADDWRRAWYDISTEAGRVTVSLRTLLTDVVADATLALDPPRIAGGAPEQLVEPGPTAAALHAELVQPFTLERHRAGLVATVAALAGGVLPALLASAAATLLAHHADDATAARMLEAIVPPGSGDGQRLATQLALPPDAAQLAAWCHGALRSPVRAKRWLGYRLLRQTGALAAGSHPDDAMPAPPGAPPGLY